MANLNINNYHNLRLSVNKDEYWDFFVNKDSYSYYGFNNDGESDKCLISKIRFSNEDEDGWIYSDFGYFWNRSVSVGYTLYDITYTGVDNGLFTFKKDRISNKEFLRFFQTNKLDLPIDDYRLRLHRVSGNTQLYEYPLHFEENHVKLNGGFLQGFFETECDKYQVLPSKFNDGDVYNFEFTLKRCDLEAESDKTLNDKYPENKGIFFYLGTRAENKWIYMYDEEDVDGLEACYQLGVEDFVEGGEVDKKDYIIGNFYDVTRLDDSPLEIDEYTNFNYYDEELYKGDSCDWEDMSYYLNVEYDTTARTIDESAEHTTLSCWCRNTTQEEEYVLRPFFSGCGCPIKYKKEKVNKDNDDFFTMDSLFGDEGYISGLEGLDDPNDTVDFGDYIENELDISDFEYESSNGFKMSEGNWYYFYTDNKFLMFDRTKDGKNVGNWIEGTQFMYCGRKDNFKGNLFILMNRTKTGYTVSDIESLREKSANSYNPYNDIYDNALAFRITDKGEIGYRLLTKDCEKEGRNKTSMMEGYSFENVIPYCEWVTVNVKTLFLGGNKMKFMFYVNGKLKYITKELPRIRLKALNEIYEKQEGVPYNISVGGGTQGLAETIQRNYMLNPTRVYPIEEYFAGTFIGYMSSFKVYDCFLEQMTIYNNFKREYDKSSLATIY